MAKFKSGDLNIHFDVSGNGAPIVLVHGFASNTHGNWREPGWIDHLRASGRRVISLDCRGHGQSDKPHNSAAYDGDIMADDVVRLMDHLDIQQAELMGYSMGARISISLLINHQDRFGAAIIGGMGSTIFNDRSKRNVDISDAMTNGEATANEVGQAFRIFAESTGADLRAMAAIMRSTNTRIKPLDLADISIPVLVVVGDKDDLVGDPKPLVDAISGCRLVILKDRDHLTAVADPDYKQAVTNFLG